MGFRKRNAKRSDNRSSAKVIMGKPASQLSKEEKKILSARMAEIRSENGGKNTVQNTIPFLCMYQDGVGEFLFPDGAVLRCQLLHCRV